MFIHFLWRCLTGFLPLPLSELLLPENRRRLPLDEQLHYLQVRLDEVSSGKHSIGQSRRAKALRKEISVIKRKLVHQQEGGSGMGGRDSVGGDRGLPHHPSSSGHHDEGGESSSQEIGEKGASRENIKHSPLVTFNYLSTNKQIIKLNFINSNTITKHPFTNSQTTRAV